MPSAGNKIIALSIDIYLSLQYNNFCNYTIIFNNANKENSVCLLQMIKDTAK